MCIYICIYVHITSHNIDIPLASPIHSLHLGTLLQRRRYVGARSSPEELAWSVACRRHVSTREIRWPKRGYKVSTVCIQEDTGMVRIYIYNYILWYIVYIYILYIYIHIARNGPKIWCNILVRLNMQCIPNQRLRGSTSGFRDRLGQSRSDTANNWGYGVIHQQREFDHQALR